MSQRPCLRCGTLTTRTRCPTCTTIHETQRTRNRQRPHYTGPYQRHSQKLRQQWTADPYTTCWICGNHAQPGDPWTADHVNPGQTDSPLAPAHRSCNSQRGNRTA